MRPGQNRRMRGRNRSKGPNPLTRSYESNGPDVKIRGTAQHIADKYAQLARDSQSSGDPVAAENYFQHAEHYYRLIAGAQEQLRQQYGGLQGGYDDDGDEEPGYGYGYANGGDRPMAAQHGDEDFGSQPQPSMYDPRQDGGDRPARFERPDRPERFDRGGDRPMDRGDQRRERFQPRQEHLRQEHPRQEHPRQDQPRPDRPPRDFQREGGEPRPDRPERQDRFPRQERQEQRPDRPERFERPDRPERQDRRDRRREEPREEVAELPTSALPAFLTNPVRAPIPVDEPPVPEVAALPTAPEAGNADGEPDARFRTRTRRRRTRATEGEAPAAAEFAPETPAAE